MAKIAGWDELPAGVRQHLIDRMRDRRITLNDLNALRLWMETQPEVPAGEWYKDPVMTFYPRRLTSGTATDNDGTECGGVTKLSRLHSKKVRAAGLISLSTFSSRL